MKNHIRDKIETIEKKERKKQNSKKYKVSPRFFQILTFLIVVAILISLYMIFSSLKTDVVFDDSLNVKDVNVSKNSEKLYELYSTDGNKDKFVQEYNNIQSAIGIYIMNNSTQEDDSFQNIIKKIKTYISKSEWDKLEVEEPVYFAGTYSIDDSGVLKFKFDSKKIEPTWINDQDVTNMVILNK